jgi:ankyrin repeat protein
MLHVQITAVTSAAMIELLLANGADLHKCDSRGKTALDVAVLCGSLQCARALIAAGADVNHIDGRGYYALHTAVSKQHAAVVQLLLENGATAAMNSVIAVKPLEDSCGGVTALMMCTTIDTVKLLLAAGADVHMTNERGDTCIAAKCKHPAPVLWLLIKAGAELQAVDSSGNTAAQLAHDAGNALIEQILNRAAQQAHRQRL